MKTLAHGHFDRSTLRTFVGAATVICGVHCLLTPLLVLAVPILALNETVEWLVLLTALPVGTLLVLKGPGPRRVPILTLLAAGGLVWVGSLSRWFHPIPEAVTSGAGSLVFASALLWSARVCRISE